MASWLSLESLNRIPLLSGLEFRVRAGIFAAVVLPTYFVLGPNMYDSMSRGDVNANLRGAPLYANKLKVPELDRVFFVIDDDNNF